MKRWSWVSFLVGAVVGLAALGIPVAIVGAVSTAEDARQAEYLECLANLGYIPGGDYDLEELNAAADLCD